MGSSQHDHATLLQIEDVTPEPLSAADQHRSGWRTSSLIGCSLIQPMRGRADALCGGPKSLAAVVVFLCR
jgi:hypothetical protein